MLASDTHVRLKSVKSRSFARRSSEWRTSKSFMSTVVGSARSLRRGFGKRGEACTCSFISFQLTLTALHRKEWLQYANWEVRRKRKISYAS